MKAIGRHPFNQQRYFDITAMDRLLRMKPILSDREKREEDEKDDDFEGSLIVSHEGRRITHIIPQRDFAGKPENDDSDFDLLTENGDVDPRGKARLLNHFEIAACLAPYNPALTFLFRSLTQVGRHVLRHGRVFYRHIFDVPTWLTERKDAVTSKSIAQPLCICIKFIMHLRSQERARSCVEV